MTTFVGIEAVVAIVAVVAAATGVDWTRILLALIALGGVYLARKVQQVHVLVNSQLEDVKRLLADALAERDEARRSEPDL
jgi:UPF0716 family protein affecting phage T7 exclusion